MAALAYVDGVGVADIAERYGFARSTVYYWLDRIETRPLQAALEDEPLQGKPPKLTAEQ